MIQVENLSKVYTSRGAHHEALNNISITIKDGESFAILGSSGAGKSTFVRCLNLLETPSGGTIIIDGVDVTRASNSQLIDVRRRISMIFQHFCLFQQKTVLDNVLFPVSLKRHVSKHDKEFALELLSRVGLAGLEARYPSQLSGGQKQRVAIARALINKPAYLICDEATSALDRQTTVSILQLLKELQAEFNISLIVITHSLEVAREISDRVAIFEHGKVVEQGESARVLYHPETEAASALVLESAVA